MVQAIAGGTGSGEVSPLHLPQAARALQAAGPEGLEGGGQCCGAPFPSGEQTGNRAAFPHTSILPPPPSPSHPEGWQAKASFQPCPIAGDQTEGSVADGGAAVAEQCLPLPRRCQPLAGGSTSAQGFVLRGAQLRLGAMSLDLRAEL